MADDAPPAVPEDAQVVDRHGHVTTERARDRKGVIAFMARNGVATNLLSVDKRRDDPYNRSL